MIIGGTYAAARRSIPERCWIFRRCANPCSLCWSPKYASLAHGLAVAFDGYCGPIKGLSFSGAACIVSLTQMSILLFLLVFRVRWPFDLILSAAAVITVTFVSGWILYSLGFFSPIASSLFGVPIGVIAEHFVECKAFGHSDERSTELTTHAK